MGTTPEAQGGLPGAGQVESPLDKADRRRPGPGGCRAAPATPARPRRCTRIPDRSAPVSGFHWHDRATGNGNVLRETSARSASTRRTAAGPHEQRQAAQHLPVGRHTGGQRRLPQLIAPAGADPGADQRETGNQLHASEQIDSGASRLCTGAERAGVVPHRTECRLGQARIVGVSRSSRDRYVCPGTPGHAIAWGRQGALLVAGAGAAGQPQRGTQPAESRAAAPRAAATSSSARWTYLAVRGSSCPTGSERGMSGSCRLADRRLAPTHATRLLVAGRCARRRAGPARAGACPADPPSGRTVPNRRIS